MTTQGISIVVKTSETIHGVMIVYILEGSIWEVTWHVMQRIGRFAVQDYRLSQSFVSSTREVKAFLLLTRRQLASCDAKKQTHHRVSKWLHAVAASQQPVTAAITNKME